MTIDVIVPSAPTITVPQGVWIPNQRQITDSAAGLLAVIGRALDDNGLGEPFTRRVFTHGDTVPLHVGDDAEEGQLIVTFANLEIGRAGEKQFQFRSGDLGRYDFMVGAFKAQLWIKWPIPEGGLSATLAPDSELEAASVVLNQATWCAFSYLRSLSLGGTGSVRCKPPVTPIDQDGMIIGPAQPLGPIGSMAGFGIDIQLQY